MDIELLSRFNDWWITGKVKRELLFSYKRYLFQKLLQNLEGRQMVLLTGLRRIGKTVLLYQLINELLQRGVNPRNIFYFSFDEERYGLEEVINTYRNEVLKHKLEKEKVFLFLDEIQKSENWANQVKIWYDLYPNLKFFLSGSASLILQRKTKESLAGRIFEFLLNPLTFREFLELKNIDVKFQDIKLYQNKILPFFFDYLRKAGFPEITEEENDEKIKLYLKSSIIDRIIYKDIPLEFGIKDLELLETLVKIIFTQPGLIVNFDAFARNLKRDKKTIINYIFYLKYSLLVKIVSNFRKEALIASRKLKKAYPATTSLIFALSPRFYEQDFSGKVMETFVINDLDAKYYYRKNGEVDIIYLVNNLPLPLEVKSEPNDEDIRKFRKTIDKLDCKRGILITKQQFKEIELQGKKILIIPAWAFAIFKKEFLA